MNEINKTKQWLIFSNWFFSSVGFIDNYLWLLTLTSTDFHDTVDKPVGSYSLQGHPVQNGLPSVPQI